MDQSFIEDEHLVWKKARCFFCQMHCSMWIGTDAENGKIVRMKEIEGDPTSSMCERIGPNGERAIKNHYHPKRINHALKRVGERGENKWEKIPYDQALDEITEKLKALIEKHGPETLGITEGTYRSDHLWSRNRFTNLLGNPSNCADPGTICWCWLYAINLGMCGWVAETGMNFTPEESKTIVQWGVRVTERCSPEGWGTKNYRAAYESKEKKPNLIVVDPVMVDSVRHATVYLPIRPGTDVAMMLGWLNVIFTEKLYDKDFTTNWTNAPFLVRTDTGKLLRETDLTPKGTRENFVAWDTNTKAPSVWISGKNRYCDDQVKNALLGEFDIQDSQGKIIPCKTVFTLLKERFEKWPVDKVAEITDTVASDIRKAARLYATEKPSSLPWGVGAVDQAGWNASSGAVCKMILRAVTGNLDIPGGDYLGEPGPIIDGKFPVRDAEFELADKCLPETREKMIGNDRFRMMGWKGWELTNKAFKEMYGIPRIMDHQMLVSAPLLWRTILESDPYPVRACICWSSNPMLWAANTKLVYKALKSLDLLVVSEYWMTPTAALADYVLPACDWMERPMFSNFEDAMDCYFGCGVPSKPHEDRRSDYEFFRGLGIRMGQEDHWPWKNLEEVMEHRLSRVNVTYEDFSDMTMLLNDTRFEKHKLIRKDGQVRGFATPSRRVELFASVFEELGYDPLPDYREPAESPLSTPEIFKEYPLVLTTGGRFTPMFHSEHRVPGTGTREMHPWPVFDIHMETARKLGIRDGDWCWIESPRGRIRQKARTGFAIKPGTVIVQPSWWFPELPVEEPWLCGVFESNANLLTLDEPETLDPACGNWTNRGLLCKVYRCEEPEWLADKLPSEMFTQGKDTFPKT